VPVIDTKRIKSALLSVFHKDGLAPVVQALYQAGVHLYSTGGTESFVRSLGIPVTPVEELTGYPSILGGRVKTLHPKVFGGLLGRRDEAGDLAQLEEYGIPPIDLAIVDLYPFEDTVARGGSHAEIIEKIDIGGVSLIRAAAKNHQDVVIVPARAHYAEVLKLITEQGASTTLAQRKGFAAAAFAETARYDAAIHTWMAGDDAELRLAADPRHPLRYGENPHQPATFHGDLDAVFDRLHGKDLSYNNLLDLDAGLALVDDLSAAMNAEKAQACFAILKHNNACGAAVCTTPLEAWNAALAADPVSAFGGVLVTNRAVDLATAKTIDSLFFEILSAPEYTPEALSVLQRKKNRILLRRKRSANTAAPPRHVRSALNGVLVQRPDRLVDLPAGMRTVTEKAPTREQLEDLTFASILVKHTKSNAIVLVKDQQLLASGTGQTSRVDALEQAIAKATKFNFDLRGAAMASDAFFPFRDCVDIAKRAGISAIVQPGGSIRDQESVDACNAHGMAMVVTGNRHFKH
jgi:phosphoribosylaminoimidazolecarboxamide formyltransferase / IMP cyclohydrolase